MLKCQIFACQYRQANSCRALSMPMLQTLPYEYSIHRILLYFKIFVVLSGTFERCILEMVYFGDFSRRSRVSQELTNIQGHNCKRSKQTHFLMSMTHLHLEFISYDRICPISAFIRPSRSQDFYFLKITSLIKSLSAD